MSEYNGIDPGVSSYDPLINDFNFIVCIIASSHAILDGIITTSLF